jgi:hypothetical protein
MTSIWSRTFKALVVVAVSGAVGLLGFGFLSSQGNLWERFAKASAFAMFWFVRLSLPDLVS